MIEREWSFARDLALELKQPSPRIMLASMSITEYREWMEHMAERGFTIDLDNFRSAQICVTNLQPHLKQGTEIKLSDFYPKQSRPEQQTAQQMMALMANLPGVTREQSSR